MYVRTVDGDVSNDARTVVLHFRVLALGPLYEGLIELTVIQRHQLSPRTLCDDITH